jgi:dihydroflavonol-4-reductase
VSSTQTATTHLVTGATGFLGRHLVRTLLDHGDSVVALVRKTARDLPPEVRQVEGDVLDRASVERALDGVSSLFHCAGKVSRRPEDAEDLHRLHVEGTKNVLDACIAKGVRRAVVASTSGTVAVGDDPDRIYTEEDEAPIGLLNRWPYYRSKLFAERAALERHGKVMEGGAVFEVVVVNPTLLLGPGDVNGSSTDDVRLFLERKIPAIPPGGLSYVDVRDAAEGMRLAMERGVGGRRYLLGACNMTLREFFARLERVSGVRGPMLPVPRAPQFAKEVRELARTGAQMLERFALRVGLPVAVDPVSLDMASFYWYLDASLAENELGWTPRDPVETLVDTVRDLEERGVVWPRDAAESTLLPGLLRRVAGSPGADAEQP